METIIQQPRDAYAGQYLREYETARYLPEGYTPHATPYITVPPEAEDLPDVSFWQGDINWDELITHTRAVIPRISQGNWIDSKWERNYTEGRRVGSLLGGYHFYDDRFSPQYQADTILSALDGKYLDLEIFIDWEVVYGGPYGGLKNVITLIKLLKSAGILAKCHDTGIYTGFYFFREHSNANANAAEYAYITTESVPLWLAWYADPTIVRVPDPWTTWTHWQYGTPVRDWGQNTEEIDMNKPNATPAQFTEKYGSGTTPPPGGDPVEEKQKGTVLITGLNVRSGPGTSYPEKHPPLGTLKKDDQVFGLWDNPGTQWFHFGRILRADGTEEIWDAWASAIRGTDPTPPYMKVENYTPPPVGTKTHIEMDLNDDGTITGTWQDI